MKKYYSVIIIVILLSNAEYSEAQSLGLNNSAPDASSILDLTATNRGLLIPRMSTAQRNAIAVPADGLLVYDLDLDAFYYYDATATSEWRALLASSKSTSSLGGWSTLGNAGTVAATNFLGTTDAIDFRIRTNNLERMSILSGGDVGIATTAPLARLHIDRNTSGKSLELTADNFDIDFRMGHYSGTENQYGFYWRYAGTGTADANYLQLWSENATGTDFNIFQFGQSSSGLDIYGGYGSTGITIEKNGDLFTSGKVGIGTSAPFAILHVTRNSNGGKILELTTNSKDIDFRMGEYDGTENEYGFYWRYAGTGTADANYLQLWSENATGADFNIFQFGHTTSGLDIYGGYDSTGITIDQDGDFFTSGNVGIGTNAPAVKLDVVGTIRGTVIQATTNGAGAYQYNTTTNMNVPDYVFDKYYTGNAPENPVYEIMPLEKLEKYIHKNRHLPRVPSRSEINKDGIINTQAISMLTLEKTEENTLYILELNKKIEEQQKIIEELRNEINVNKKEMESIIKALQLQLNVSVEK